MTPQIGEPAPISMGRQALSNHRSVMLVKQETKSAPWWALLNNRYFWLILILLVGFALRLNGLADVGVNNDESYDYHRWIHESLRAIVIDDLRLNNQVLAHILARLSLLFLGDSLFNLRWPSLCLSVLGLAFIFKFARLLFDTRVGLVSMLLLAISPYAIFFAHSFRGYGGVIVLPILVYLLAWLALRQNRWVYWLAFSLAAAMMIYTHLFTTLALLNLALLVGLGWWFGHIERPPLGRCGVALSITALILTILYAPVWTKIVQAVLGSGQETLSTFLWEQHPEVSASIWYNLWLFNGFWQPGSQSGHGVYVLLGLVFIALSLGLSQPDRWRIWLLFGWTLLPFIEIWLIRRIFNGFWARPPYLGYTLPPLLILAAFAITQLPPHLAIKRLPSVALLILPIGLLSLFWYPALTEYYRVFAGAEWEAVGDFLQKNSTVNDLVVCQQYHHAWRDVQIDREDLCTRTLNYRREADTAMVAPVLTTHELVYGLLPQANTGVISRQGRVWLVVWNVPPAVSLTSLPGVQAKFDGLGRSIVLLADQQPTYVANLAEVLAALRATSGVPDQQFIYSLMIAPLARAGGQTELAQQALELAHASLPDHPEATTKLAVTEQLVDSLSAQTIDHVVQANFGQEIMLRGYNLDPASVRPGVPLKLTLYWQAMQSIKEDYTVFLHLRDQTGRTIAQFDYQPFDGSYPTQHWQVDQSLSEVREFSLPLDFPAGKYNLVIGLYNRITLERLPLVNDQSGENALLLTSLIVE